MSAGFEIPIASLRHAGSIDRLRFLQSGEVAGVGHILTIIAKTINVAGGGQARESGPRYLHLRKAPTRALFSCHEGAEGETSRTRIN